MVDKKNGNRRVGAGSTGHAPSSAESGGVCGGVTVDVDRVIKGACRGFARAADWRQVSHVELRGGILEPKVRDGLSIRVRTMKVCIADGTSV